MAGTRVSRATVVQLEMSHHHASIKGGVGSGVGREEQTEPMPAPWGCCPPQNLAGCGLDAAGIGGFSV